MKRILCTSIAFLMLLTACSTPVQIPEPSTEQDVNATHGMYEFALDAEQLSGWSFEGWDFAYTYNGEEICDGHQILLSPEIFSFHSIRVDVIERDAPNNQYSATFPVAICHGGSGKTEVTVTDSGGRTVTFRITCRVTRIGKQ